jgi:dethiobiotin synthetase
MFLSGDRMKGIFITGTDTGVGKTVAAAAIARLLRDRGIDVGVMKPVTSGCALSGGKRFSEDAGLLAFGARLDHGDPDIAPYCLEAPLAPAVAASMEGTRIDFNRIRDAYQRLAAQHDFVVVEGAGGLMVPLAGGLMVADLVGLLALPLLVIARPDLGTVNHTILTCFAAKQVGLDLRGVVINNYPGHPDRAAESAPHLIGSLSGTQLLGVFPHIDSQDLEVVVEQLAEQLAADPTTGIMLREIGVR